jgi:RND family efflux transporter MFP subunit
MRLAGRRAIAPIAAALVLLALSPDAGFAQGKPTVVHVDTVVSEPLRQTTPVLGRFVARQSGDVAAFVGGPVSEVLVEVGDRVRKGDRLVRQDAEFAIGTRDLRAAEVREKAAALEKARAQLRLVSLELNRLQRLKKSPAFSQARFEDKRAEVLRYRSGVAEAEAAVARARANEALAELALSRTVIVAPFNGVVVYRHTMAGAYVSPGAPVVTLVNDEDMEIEADIPADRLPGLTAGRMVGVRLDNGVEFKATVRAVIPTENALTRTRPVRFTPEGANGASRGLATDQSVTVLLPVGEERQIVTVHKDAVIVKGGKSLVFLVAEGKAMRRQVRLGEASGVRFEVLSGLVAGDVVVVRGNERLRPGQAVTYKGMKQAGGENAGRAPSGDG